MPDIIDDEAGQIDATNAQADAPDHIPDEPALGVPATKEPNMSGFKQEASKNLSQPAATEKKDAAPSGDAEPLPPPVSGADASPLDTVTEAIQRGFNMSTTGLRQLGKIDDTPDPKNTQWYYGVAKAAGQMYGDIPEMLEGMAAGVAVGSAVPVVGNVAGGIAGSFALPAMVRKHLIDQYQKGDIQTFQDFYTRAGGMILEGSKAATLGIATTAVGGKAGEALAKTALPAVAQTIGRLASEVVVAGNMGAAMESRAPNADDFMTAGVLMAGMHAVGAGASVLSSHIDHVSGKLQGIYADTGVLPHNVVADAKNDPYLHQEVVSSNVSVPKNYEHLVESSPEAPQMIQVNPPKDAEPIHPLSKDFSDPMGMSVPDEDPYAAEPPKPKSSGSSNVPMTMEAGEQEFQNRIQPSTGSGPEDTAGIYERMFRQLKPIDDMVKALGGNDLPPSKNPAILAQLHTGVLSKATYFIMPRGGSFDFHTLGDTGVRSLSDINTDAMKANPDNPKGFMAFEVAKQTIAEEARGRETGMDLEVAKGIVARDQGTYGKLAKEKTDLRNSVFKYLADSGVISQEHYVNALVANADYVPMNRILGDEAVKSGGKGLTVSSPVRRRAGSDRLIQDTNESDIKNIINYVVQAETNRVGMSLVALSKREGGESYLEEVQPKSKPISVYGSDFEQMVKKSGGGGDLGGLNPDEKLGEIWRPMDLRSNPKTQIQIMDDGKPRVFNADPAIVRAFTGMDEGSRGIAVNLAASLANTLRAGYTALSPSFALTHTLRQQVGAAPIFSEHTYVPFVSMVQGALEANKMGDSMREFMKTGAGSDTVASATRAFIQAKELYDLDQHHNTGVMDSRSNVIKSPLELNFWTMKNALAASEAAREMTRRVVDLSPLHKAIVGGDQSTRVWEFSKSYEGGDGQIDSKLTAAMNARKVLADISVSGSALKGMNRITPFFNAGLQNMDAFASAISDNPTRTLTRAAMYGTLPALITYAANHDKDWWNEMAPWERFGFLHAEVDGHIVKMPLGESAKLAAGFPIAVLDAIKQKEPGLIADWAKETLRGLVPDVSTIFKPSLEQWANKSMLTGAPLIPRRLENVLPGYQTKPSTSALATLYGRAAQNVPGLKDSSFASPIIADNYGQSWLGAAYGLGNYAADKAIYASGALPDPNRPEKNWDQNPFVKSFFLSQDSYSSETINKFEEAARENDKYQATIKDLAKKGDFDAMTSLVRSSEFTEHAMAIKGAEHAVSSQMSVIRKIEDNKLIAPVDKKVIIDGAIKQMDAASKAGTFQIEAYKKAVAED